MSKVRVLRGGNKVEVVDVTDNSFCPTGKGGGVDPTCGKGGKGKVRSSGSGKEGDKSAPKVPVRKMDDINSIAKLSKAEVSLKKSTQVGDVNHHEFTVSKNMDKFKSRLSKAGWGGAKFQDRSGGFQVTAENNIYFFSR